MATYSTKRRKPRPLEERTRPGEFFEGVLPGRPTGLGPTGPLGPTGAPPAQPIYDPRGAPGIDEIMFPQRAELGAGPSADDILDRMGNERDWRSLLFDAETLRADDFDEGGAKVLAQVQKIAQDGEGIVDVRPVGQRMRDSLRTHLLRQAQRPALAAAPAGPPMPKLSAHIEKRLSTENMTELESRVMAHESMSPQDYRTNEDFLYAHQEYLANRKRLEESQRAEQIMALSKDVEKMAEINQKRPAEMSQMEWEAYELANEYERQLYRAAAPERRVEARAGMVEAGLVRTPEGRWERAEPRAEEERVEEQFQKASRVAWAAAQRKERRATAAASRKAQKEQQAALAKAKTLTEKERIAKGIQETAVARLAQDEQEHKDTVTKWDADREATLKAAGVKTLSEAKKTRVTQLQKQAELYQGEIKGFVEHRRKLQQDLTDTAEAHAVPKGKEGHITKNAYENRVADINKRLVELERNRKNSVKKREATMKQIEKILPAVAEARAAAPAAAAGPALEDEMRRLDSEARAKGITNAAEIKQYIRDRLQART